MSLIPEENSLVTFKTCKNMVNYYFPFRKSMTLERFYSYSVMCCDEGIERLWRYSDQENVSPIISCDKTFYLSYLLIF